MSVEMLNAVFSVTTCVFDAGKHLAAVNQLGIFHAFPVTTRCEHVFAEEFKFGKMFLAVEKALGHTQIMCGLKKL